LTAPSSTARPRERRKTDAVGLGQTWGLGSAREWETRRREGCAACASSPRLLPCPCLSAVPLWGRLVGLRWRGQRARQKGRQEAGEGRHALDQGDEASVESQDRSPFTRTAQWKEFACRT
jgi:hypothetical protein